MNAEPKNTTSGDESKDDTQPIHSNNVKNIKSSTAETSNLLGGDKDDKDDSAKTCGQKFAHTSNSSSSGNLIIDQKDGGTKEAGQKRNSNHPRRNHFTRSRNPKPSSPLKNKAEQQPKLVSFYRLCIHWCFVSAMPTIRYSRQRWSWNLYRCE